MESTNVNCLTKLLAALSDKPDISVQAAIEALEKMAPTPSERETSGMCCRF